MPRFCRVHKAVFPDDHFVNNWTGATACREARLAAWIRYVHSPKGVATRKRYALTDKHAASDRRYEMSEKGHARKAIHNLTERRKAGKLLYEIRRARLRQV